MGDLSDADRAPLSNSPRTLSAMAVFSSGSAPPRRPLSPLFVGSLAAGLVAVAFSVIVAFPRTTSSRQPPPPGDQQWGAIYEEIRRVPVQVQAPAELPGGHRLTSLSMWRPGWFGSATVWHWVFAHEDGRWLLISADPTHRHKLGGPDGRMVTGLGMVRSHASAGLAGLEWDTAGHAMRIDASGIPIEELERVAAGISPQTAAVDDEPPALDYLPPDLMLISRTGERASTVGPGEAGWRATYFIAGADGGTVTITAAEGRMFPLADLSNHAPTHGTTIRGQRGLVFVYPTAGEAGGTTHSRLIWLEAGSMLEASSGRLDAAALLPLVNDLDLTLRD